MGNSIKNRTTKSENINNIGIKKHHMNLGILGADTIKQVKTKEKIRNVYLERARNFLETKLSRRYLIKEINVLAVYWEESWRLEATCRHSNSSERSSANTDEKNSQGVNDNNNNRPKNKKTYDHAYGIISQRRRWQNICIKKRGMKGTRQHWRQHWRINKTRRLYTKTRWRTHYSHRKRNW